MKGQGPTSLEPLGEGDGWATWQAYPEESMARASHAIRGDDGWWLVDPVDADDLDDWLDDRGEVAGVVLLLDRHVRDAEAVAERHGVDVHAPDVVARGVADDLDGPVERVGARLGDTGFEPRTVVDRRVWRESALVGPDGDVLVVPEAVGTAALFRTGDERVGVHPALRPRPPRRSLGDLAPEHLLVGHGEPVTDDAAGALSEALAGARRRMPRLYAEALRAALPV